jgi:hypothetical protein
MEEIKQEPIIIENKEEVLEVSGLKTISNIDTTQEPKVEVKEETVSKAEYELVKQQLEELKKASAKATFLANDGREDAFEFIYKKYEGKIDLPVISANDSYVFKQSKVEEPKKYKSKEAEL